MSASFHYGIRKRVGDVVTTTHLRTPEAVARSAYQIALEQARGQGYVVVQLEKNHHVAAKYRGSERIDFKFFRLARELEPVEEMAPVRLAVKHSLLSFGRGQTFPVASVRLQGAE